MSDKDDYPRLPNGDIDDSGYIFSPDPFADDVAKILEDRGYCEDRGDLGCMRDYTGPKFLDLAYVYENRRLVHPNNNDALDDLLKEYVDPPASENDPPTSENDPPTSPAERLEEEKRGLIDLIMWYRTDYHKSDFGHRELIEQVDAAQTTEDLESVYQVVDGWLD